MVKNNFQKSLAYGSSVEKLVIEKLSPTEAKQIPFNPTSPHHPDLLVEGKELWEVKGHRNDKQYPCFPAEIFSCQTGYQRACRTHEYVRQVPEELLSHYLRSGYGAKYICQVDTVKREFFLFDFDKFRKYLLDLKLTELKKFYNSDCGAHGKLVVWADPTAGFLKKL